MADIQYLQKDDQVGSGNYGYKAISIEKVTESVRQAMIRHGLVIFPIEQVHMMEDKARLNNQGQQVLVPITTVDVRYKMVNVDKPEEFEIVVSSGTGTDPQDKGVGKAMTYAYKNLLLKTFAIPTGDDTDKTHNKELEEQQNKAAAKAAEEAKKPMSDPQRAEILEWLKDPAQTEETIKRVTGKMDKFTKEEAQKAIQFLKKQVAEKAVTAAKTKANAA